MLTPREREEIEAALFVTLNEQANPRLQLVTIFGQQAVLVTATLKILDTPADYATQVIDRCLADRWAHDPSLLETLLKYLGPRGCALADSLVARVESKKDPNPDPCNAFWLRSERPFFDRTDLRRSLGRLMRETTHPILRVEASPDGFGRSYSRELIQHVAAEMPGDTRVIAVGISRGTGLSYTCEDLAEELVSQLGCIESAPNRSTGSSYSRVVSRFVLSRLVRGAALSIIVLDGFGQPDLNSEVRQTIETVADWVTTAPEYRDRVRLVLIDYGDLPAQVRPSDVLVERLAPASQVVGADLQPVLDAISEIGRASGGPGLVAADIPAIVQQIVSSAPAGGKERLDAFNVALCDAWAVAGGRVP